MTRLIVFVCEHGAAKSMVAAAWLQRLADEAGLPLRGVSCGTDPAPSISPVALEGLESDGIGLADRVPRPIRSDELRRAWRVISLGPELSTVVPPEIPLETWSVPAVSDGYESARDVIVANLRALLTAAQAATRVGGRVLDRPDGDRPSAR